MQMPDAIKTNAKNAFRANPHGVFSYLLEDNAVRTWIRPAASN